MKNHLYRIASVTILFFIQVQLFSQLPGMHTRGRYLFSANGDTVILKGFNAMIVYWDIHGDTNFPEIEKTGANCVRIFWNLAAPTPTPSDLDKVLANCISHHMIPVICLWDATGKWDKIQTCVDYWCSAPIVTILKKYEKQLIINIANEPGDHEMGNTVFRNTYSAAVQQMRNSGLQMPLIIDADRWGRNADAILDNGQYLIDNDPVHNLVFSWHLWDPKNLNSGTLTEIDRIIAKAADSNICFIVGEFGPCEQTENCSATQINWEYLIEKAYKNNIGYLPWVWKWSDCHTIVNNKTGSYGSWSNATWGENVAVQNAYSIGKTSRRPSDLLTGVINVHEGRIFKNNSADEMVFLHTDRADYMAGESIFFKALILNEKTVNSNQPFEILNIALTDQAGLEVASGKFNIKNGISMGSIELSRFLAEGYYVLLACTDNMKNASPEMIFSGIIDVKNPKSSGIQASIALNDSLYTPGSKLRANISISGKKNMPVAVSYTYLLVCKNAEIYSGKDKTGADGNSILEIPLPAFQADDTLKLFVNTSYKGTKIRSGIVIPTPGNHTDCKIYDENKLWGDNNKHLSISIKPNKQQYANDEKVVVEINVTDSQGIPVVASISVSASNPDPHFIPLHSHENLNCYQLPAGGQGINLLWRSTLLAMKEKALPEDMSAYPANEQVKEEVFNLQVRKFFVQCLSLFNQIPGKSFNVQDKNDPGKINRKQSASIQQKQYGYRPDQKITDIISQIKPFQIVGGKIVFANSGINSFYYQDGALIVIDGVNMGTDMAILNSIPVTDIAKINVYTNPSDIQRYTGLNSVGVIEIISKRGNEDRENKEPVYRSESSAFLWEPEILTDKNGNATVSFSITSSPVTISVAAITGNGLAGFNAIQLPAN